MNTSKKISIVVPCYNEEEGLQTFYDELIKHLPPTYQYELVFINDGSQDTTFQRLKELAVKDDRVRYLSFSRNFGHQNALKAGFDYATGDCAISMDADLQHPPKLLNVFIEKWEEGSEIVNSVREDHESISLSKRLSSRLFYLFINKLSDVAIGKGMADFRLLDRKVLDQLKQFKENYIFFRGLFPWMGFNQVNINYKAGERFAGETKYTVSKMLRFASNGVTSFSIKPLRYSIYLGLIFAALAFLYLLYALYIYFFTDQAMTGWTSIVMSIVFFGGINLIMLGLIGEYLGKLFIENKRRPNYLIAETNFKS